MTEIVSRPVAKRLAFRTITLLLIPIVLLAGVIALFLSTGGGLDLEAPVPVENLTVENYVLERNQIHLHVRNTGPDDLTIASVIINDAVMPFTVTPDPTLPRLGRAEIHVNYAWNRGEAYGVTIFSSNAIPFAVDIPVAFETPQPSARTFWGFTLIGLYVGVIPVFLGIFWFPALRQLGRRTMTFLMAATAGLLIFLGLDTIAEALEVAAKVPSAFQGIGLIGIGAVATFLLLDAISRRQTHVTGSDTSSNALFGKLQAVAARKTGASPILLAAANTTGGVTGKMISPQSIAVATAAANLAGREGGLFRHTVKHSLALALIIAVMTMVRAYVLKGMVP